MFAINRAIGDMDTLFFPAKTEHLYISSTFVREMILYGKDISDYVPGKVKEFIENRCRAKTFTCFTELL
jgi:pantetheine-phosphate adenylyltransferase